mmetsp:Transcript_30466/g.97213  ORF Transcript_30466/g.97213 Transcript_30466/m.97213 type:complete len:137 (-) Transcript_30466:225-635(-)
MAEVAMDVEVDDVLAAQRQGGRLRRLRDGSNLRFRNYRPRDEKLRELFEKTPRAILYLDLEEVAAAPLSEDQQKAVEALTAIQRELKEQVSRLAAPSAHTCTHRTHATYTHAPLDSAALTVPTTQRHSSQGRIRTP